jgi:DUF305 family protein family protein
MFVGSLIIGIYFNAMNVLADDYSHLYFTSTTLIYSALFMASNMALLEVFMHYSHGGALDITTLVSFLTLSILLIYALRQQTFVDDEQWLKRMISHHSTALTTSKRTLERTENEDVRELASSIVKTQKEEIQIMEELLKSSNLS